MSAPDFVPALSVSPGSPNGKLIPHSGATPKLTALAVNLVARLSIGIAFVDRTGRLDFASNVAHAHMRRGDRVRLAGHTVEAAIDNDRPRLALALSNACDGLRSLVVLGRGESAPLDVAVSPLGELGLLTGAAMIFGGQSAPDPLIMFAYSRACGLTPAEQAVLGLLCDGLSVIEVATTRNCSVHTARSHVRSILEKTGEDCLRRLVRRVCMLPQNVSRNSAGLLSEIEARLHPPGPLAGTARKTEDES